MFAILARVFCPHRNNTYVCHCILAKVHWHIVKAPSAVQLRALQSKKLNAIELKIRDVPGTLNVTYTLCRRFLCDTHNSGWRHAIRQKEIKDQVMTHVPSVSNNKRAVLDCLDTNAAFTLCTACFKQNNSSCSEPQSISDQCGHSAPRQSLRYIWKKKREKSRNRQCGARFRQPKILNVVTWILELWRQTKIFNTC